MPLQHAFHVDWMARQHTMSDSINIAEMSAEDLQRRLAERNRLVEELTSRLEQAAEQLDRLRRSGADRGSRALGIPPELIEQQKSLTEELQNAVQQWEDMQPTELLARVEMQVGELRDLIVDRLDKAVLPVPSVAGAD
jgi:septal ring factor EnvC (AmiA/AmiB activator)